MSLIYITGPPGVGKSAVINELLLRGYTAKDADNELCDWYDDKTGQRVDYPKEQATGLVEWENDHSFRFSEELTRKFAEDKAREVVYVAGNAPANDLEMANKYFDKVICLETDEQTMVNRILARDTFYGKDPNVLAHLKQNFRSSIETYSNYGATMIDANQSLNQVVNQILKTTDQA